MTEKQFERFYNVSARLKEHDYMKLVAVHEKYSSISKGKVSMADVIREAIVHLHIEEIEKTIEKKIEEETQKEVLTEAENVDNTEKILKPKNAAAQKTEEKEQEKTSKKGNTKSIVEDALLSAEKDKEREESKKNGLDVSKILKEKATSK